MTLLAAVSSAAGTLSWAAAAAISISRAMAPEMIFSRPVFMAGGWFTRVHLPARLTAAGGAGWRVLEPMGCDPAIHARVCAEVDARLVTDRRYLGWDDL